MKARGFEVFIDRHEISALEEWWKRIETLITQADTIVFVLSPDLVGSKFALKEIDFAASLNKRFAPIVYRRVDNEAVPETLAKLNYIFFDDGAKFEASADTLARALRIDIVWIRLHTEFGDVGAAMVRGEPTEWIVAAPAVAGGSGALDRGKTGRCAGTDRGDPYLH